MYTYFSNFSLNINLIFCKGYSAQQCFLAVTEKIKEARDNNKVCTEVHTDLLKAFDCIFHNLLIGKLHVFSFDFKSLRVIY